MRRTSRTSLDDREDAARRKRRAAANWKKWNEERWWFLTCPGCEHQGEVHMTLTRLKAANLKCSECGTYIWRNDQS
jgi:transcription elongation factor Elf1